jgi:DNA-directed RNA polymerase specialized sigma24 family protein
MNIPFLTQEWFISTRRRLIIFFAVERCPDPQNCVDETIFRVVRAISKGTTIHVKLETYVYAVAKIVEKECIRRRVRLKEFPLDEKTPEPPRSDDADEEAIYFCLEKCLQQLSSFEHALIFKYHEGTKSGDDKQNRIVLAERLGMPIKKLRKEAMKIRQKLESCIADCLER